ncbi:enoyl-CoA delta isomerase 2-like isoform X2 [Macrobrachium rosenbergii]|uniref:enoyl-CoA delta isomerase 2-like isoform X2 n=1 Tax=Macrobrachium rosenbergii TaxID=79674 RepID=UPI0034D76306
MSALHAARRIFCTSAKVRYSGGTLRHALRWQPEWSASKAVCGSTLPQQPMSSQATYETLSVTCEDGLRTITYNRPDKKNAISEKMFEEVVAALKEAADDPNTLITATTGAGNVYTAGNDLKNFRQMSVAEIADLLIKYFAAFIDFPKPLVAVVNGAAVGAGTTLLPMYDAVFATERAIFFTPFSSLGITAEGCSTYTFPMVMGHSRATELLLFEKKVNATEACKLGLVTEVFPDSTFQEQVWPRVRAMTKLPPKSLLYSKRLCREVHRAKLHEVNIAESKRVAERFGARLWPDSEGYKKFASSLPPLPANTKI